MSVSGTDSQLTSELKAWLDNVIVPALVREYLTETKTEEEVASEGPDVAKSADKNALTAKGRV